jgi:hypothetical protein
MPFRKSASAWVSPSCCRAVFSAISGESSRKGPLRLEREDIGPRGAFEIVHAREGLGHGFADEENAVIAHDHGADRGILKQAGAAGAFLLQREAAIILVDDLAVVEHGRGLVDRGRRLSARAARTVA